MEGHDSLISMATRDKASLKVGDQGRRCHKSSKTGCDDRGEDFVRDREELDRAPGLWEAKITSLGKESDVSKFIST